MADIDWTFQLAEQLDWHWHGQLRPRLTGMTDAEYRWEPAPGAWNVRPRGTSSAPLAAGAGEFTADFAMPAPDPAPVTTIAWRLGHIVVGVLGMRVASHFGGPPVDYSSHRYPGDAASALEQLDTVYASWMTGYLSRPLPRQLGVGHQVTLTARSHLAEAYLAVGRAAESFASYRMLVTDAERILGASHPVTLAARENLVTLAAAYLAHQQADEAIVQYRRLLADLETAARPDRQAVITARLQLASAYRLSGRPREAIAFYRQGLADSERYLGPVHPTTRTVRADLEAATRG